MMEIKGLFFKKTCAACPEQYDVLKDGKQVGYVRLRHGCLRVDAPDCDDQTILYSDDVIGDGVFEESEREQWLNTIADKINEYYASNKP